jgi:hypothetical protein
LSGLGQDQSAFVWFLAWWPFAITHHLNPFYTHFVWQPVGISIAWATSVPLLGLLLAPITLIAGSVVAYNLAIIMAPACSAFSFYVLARRLTSSEAAALIGGYLYGFSTYVLQQDNAALNLCLVPIPPLMLLLVVDRLKNRLSARRFILNAALLLTLQFLLSLEIAAFCVVFGFMAWCVALVYLSPLRLHLYRLLTEILAAGLLFAIVVSPLLWELLQTRRTINLPFFWRYYYVADLANIFIPSAHNFWGCLSGWNVTAHGGQEEDAYLGLPWLGILAAQLPAARHAALTRYLLVIFVVLLVASLGPQLWVDGHYLSITLPWTMFSSLPLLGQALPARFALFASLAAALLAVQFLERGGRWRLCLGALAAVAILPSPHVWRPCPNASFFAPGRVQAVLGTAPQLLILPFANNGPSSYWQMESQFAFTQTGGYLGYRPAAVQSFPGLNQIFAAEPGPGFAAAVAHFAMATGTQFLVLGPGTKPEMARALTSLDWPTRHVDDVTILTVPHA